MLTKNKIRFGVVGMQGYSRSHIGSILSAIEYGEDIELAAVYAYKRELDEGYASELEQKGIKIVSSFEKLLDLREIDFITLPVGIYLHSAMGLAALDKGFNVYLEKPVAGSIQEVDALIKAEKGSGKKVFIGYQDCFQPSVRDLKNRFLSGDIGRLKKIVVSAAWPRTASYYKRNNWAGKLSVNGTAVLDSPLNNACAHYMNLALFLAGKSIDRSASPVSVESELYRANDIESADTVSVRVLTKEKTEIVWTSSHACEENQGPFIRVEGDSEVINTDLMTDRYKNMWYRGYDKSGSVFFTPETGYTNPFAQVARYTRGDKRVPVCTLKMARAHTLVVNGAHLASPIVDIPCGYKKSIDRENGDILTAVDGMNDAIRDSYRKGCLLYETGSVPWSRPAGRKDIRNLLNFQPLL
jgi:predicted dehydrogenase